MPYKPKPGVSHAMREVMRELGKRNADRVLSEAQLKQRRKACSAGGLARAAKKRLEAQSKQ